MNHDNTKRNLKYNGNYQYNMSEVFQLCENNFYNSIRSAQKHLSHPPLNQFQLSEATEAVKEATQELNKMEIQYNINRQPHFKEKIDIFKEELKKYKRQLMKSKKEAEEVEMQSDELFEKQTEENGIDPLIEAKRQMYENEAISNQVAVNMKKNNDTLIKNINKMDDINNQLTVAQKLLSSIQKKMKKNKKIFIGVLIFLILMVCLIAYSYFQGNTTVIEKPVKVK